VKSRQLWNDPKYRIVPLHLSIEREGILLWRNNRAIWCAICWIDPEKPLRRRKSLLIPVIGIPP
jgi:hypothetical protein